MPNDKLIASKLPEQKTVKAKKSEIKGPLPKAPAKKSAGTAKSVDTEVITKKVTPKKSKTELPIIKSTPIMNAAPNTGLKIRFLLKFHTTYGQNLFISGNHALLGNEVIENALPLTYKDDNTWTAEIELDGTVLPEAGITYNYVLKNADGTISYDWGKDKTIYPSLIKNQEVTIIDSWNFAGYFDNAFYTVPFQQVLLKANHTAVAVKETATATHQFKVKTPLLSKGQTLCIIGYGKKLGNWSRKDPILLSRKEGDNFYTVNIDLGKEPFPLVYKYGVYDVTEGKFIRFEDGNNRVLADETDLDQLTIVNDGFAVLPNNTC